MLIFSGFAEIPENSLLNGFLKSSQPADIDIIEVEISLYIAISIQKQKSIGIIEILLEIDTVDYAVQVNNSYSVS